MESTVLAPLSGDDADAQARSRVLRVGASSDDYGQGIVVGSDILVKCLFSSVHEKVIARDLSETFRLAPENPFLTSREKERLDASGVIPVGSLVRSGDVLASLLRILCGGAPPGYQRAHDASATVPFGWDGARVTYVTCRPHDQGRPVDAQQLLTITLQVKHDLVIGDLLLCDGSPLGIVALFLADEDMPRDRSGNRADLIVTVTVGQRLGIRAGAFKSLSLAKAALRADEAARWHRLGRSLLDDKPWLIAEHSEHLEYLVLINDLAGAVKSFERHLSYALEHHSPLERYDFLRATVLLFRSLIKAPNVTPRFCLPESFPLFKKEGRYDLAELADWFESEARALAAQFDARSGNRFRTNQLDALQGLENSVQSAARTRKSRGTS
ncbi:MAG TPA: hypothetical protein VGX78_08690 [Pirellulales bacterium]|jgi:DNA-directed RNA polymerase beta subunit|nr:hypothetical protein [Pirellulales bacterium]